jgi:hypothetical protein
MTKTENLKIDIDLRVLGISLGEVVVTSNYMIWQKACF